MAFALPPSPQLERWGSKASRGYHVMPFKDSDEGAHLLLISEVTYIAAAAHSTALEPAAWSTTSSPQRRSPPAETISTSALKHPCGWLPAVPCFCFSCLCRRMEARTLLHSAILYSHGAKGPQIRNPSRQLPARSGREGVPICPLRDASLPWGGSHPRARISPSHPAGGGRASACPHRHLLPYLLLRPGQLLLHVAGDLPSSDPFAAQLGHLASLFNGRLRAAGRQERGEKPAGSDSLRSHRPPSAHRLLKGQCAPSRLKGAALRPGRGPQRRRRCLVCGGCDGAAADGGRNGDRCLPRFPHPPCLLWAGLRRQSGLEETGGVRKAVGHLEGGRWDGEKY